MIADVVLLESRAFGRSPDPPAQNGDNRLCPETVRVVPCERRDRPRKIL